MYFCIPGQDWEWMVWYITNISNLAWRCVFFADDLLTNRAPCISHLLLPCLVSGGTRWKMYHPDLTITALSFVFSMSVTHGEGMDAMR